MFIYVLESMNFSSLKVLCIDAECDRPITFYSVHGHEIASSVQW